ncbi:MAG: endonuclease/exonuclease/phosphatase family protein [Deltaproteobacteria bacterium]|nr:endonuclease/exonuclease/phosphatase family protein [Deltaproteobacteria bacterium]
MRALHGLVTVLILGSAPGRAGQVEHRLNVMTWNLFVGVHFADARKEYRSIWTLPQTVDRLFAQVAENDFRVRALALAREIDARRPDVICLQEVALWRRAAGPAFDARALGTFVAKQDFLAILKTALRGRGLAYRVAAVGENEDLRVPSLRRGRIRLTDRNAILISEQIRVVESRSGRFAAQRELRWRGFRFAFRRGWAAAVLERGGRRFRVLDVHLDLDPKIKRAQVGELLAMVSRGDLPTVVAGDFNLDPDRLAWLRRAFARHGLTDAWPAAGRGPGGTCCQAKPLTRRRSGLRVRVDLILASREFFQVRAAQRLGASQAARARFPDGRRRWISDHAGVAAELVGTPPRRLRSAFGTAP